MSTEQKIGAELHGDDPEARRLAAATMGSARTPAKVEAARQNALAAAEARKGAGTSDAQKEAVRAYWERYRQEKAAATPTAAETTTAPKRRGRPASPKPEQPAPARPRGRPRKVEAAQTAAEQVEAAQTGA